MNCIKGVLEDQRRTQRWLADKLGKSYNMVNAYVQNRQQPRVEILYEIAELLSVDVKDLLVSNKIEVK
jgi:transcriptional regulator with XRE-family HTH domain